ncbi:hypothetical protein VTN96DRAFT_7138 [Rasamsonia emersonii]|uniref:ABM domain-containing protein n=1 Tax=Rasamsonia emersonii (strain ATCC 16479 / CBS 393.64 / IMI 116815) TaxID=1408163 RepID=A0A0F4Z623_RASE3|nr:hypothetical protein T310_0156 [Rasamsonia emersonii CBS 393.64]KKA25770.1 hypothetical protein T310_0156 [Rasamsonia emersonii CBS 393.64]
MSSSFNGVSLHVSITIAPENVPKFFEAFKPVYDKVIAEPECTFFEVHQSPDEPGVLSWVENWSKPKEWLIQHQLTKEYYKEYIAITEPMFLKPREIKVLNRLGSPYVLVKEDNGGIQTS